MTRKLVSFDWAIKKLLRSKVNFGILEGFISELLFTDIKIMEVIESESIKEDKFNKFNRVDSKVTDSVGKIIIIEIHFERQLDFLHRILFSSSKTILEHLREAASFSEISKVISINILYFEFGEGDDYIYHGKTKFIGMHNKKELELSESQKKLYSVEKVADIYPEYYLIEVSNFDNIAKNTLDEWIYFLKNEEIKDGFNAKGLNEAKKKLDILKLNESERLRYEAYQYQLHQNASMYESSYLDGERKGREKGKEEGREEGREEGAKNKGIKIAKKMLLKDISIEDIIEMTDLTKDEIENLK